MRLTKQQKLLAGVLTVALSGLAIDRAIFAPQQASASSATDDFTVPASTDAATNLATQAGSPTLTTPIPRQFEGLADRLIAVADKQSLDLTNVPDVFTAAWRPTVLSQQDHSDTITAEQFTASHRLTAVMGSGRSGYAVVDGRCVRPGDDLEGFRLVAISDRAARFSTSQGVEVTLAIAATTER